MIKEKLDEIAKEAAKKSLLYNESGRTTTIRAALDKAIEAVLTAEPSPGMRKEGRLKVTNRLCARGETHALDDLYRAMTSALLERTAGREMTGEDIVCPFCAEGRFDLIGLKLHLMVYCEEYEKMPLNDLPEEENDRS